MEPRSQSKTSVASKTELQSEGDDTSQPKDKDIHGEDRDFNKTKSPNDDKKGIESLNQSCQSVNNKRGVSAESKGMKDETTASSKTPSRSTSKASVKSAVSMKSTKSKSSARRQKKGGESVTNSKASLRSTRSKRSVKEPELKDQKGADESKAHNTDTYDKDKNGASIDEKGIDNNGNHEKDVSESRSSVSPGRGFQRIKHQIVLCIKAQNQMQKTKTRKIQILKIMKVKNLQIYQMIRKLPLMELRQKQKDTDLKQSG